MVGTSEIIVHGENGFIIHKSRAPPTPTVGYNYFVNAIVWGERIVAVTGRKLLVFNYSDVERALGGEPLLTPYKAYVDRVRGVLYVARRLSWMLRL